MNENWLLIFLIELRTRNENPFPVTVKAKMEVKYIHRLTDSTKFRVMTVASQEPLSLLHSADLF